MREPPQRSFQTAQNDRQIRIGLFGQLGVNRRAAVRACATLAARRIFIFCTRNFCHRVVADHTVYVAAADEEAVLRLSEPLKILAVTVAGLCQHAHLVALCFQQTADDGRTKAGVVHIGVAAHDHEIQLIPSPRFHVRTVDGKKFGINVFHVAPLFFSCP